MHNIKYYNIKNTNINGYNSFVGNIVLFDKNETYNVVVKNGFLEIIFLNNCSNNTVLFEENQICKIKNNILDDINISLNSYFDEKLMAPFDCHNC